MANVRKIEVNTASVPKSAKIRVAAYCRVSTDNADQLESLETQKTHYESWIPLHSNWEYAGLYYDSGITGTKAEIREGLQNMLRDCRIGKIDLIVVKSISRLSRNTTDCLSIVRELLGLGVKIYFEKENINTGDMKGELILAILSSMAESESVSISENEKWAISKRMSSGSFKIVYPPYGYTRDADGNMVIEPDEAAVVRFIFSHILAGYGTDKVARSLEQQHIPTRKGGKWSGSTVGDIVANEKYVGDSLFQKTYTDTHFHRHHNHGEKETFHIYGHHEPIVSREEYEKANALIRQRGIEKGIIPGAGNSLNRYPFSGKIICDDCGAKFFRRIHEHGAEIAWACQTHLKDIRRCPVKYIRDDAIKAALVTMLNKLIFSRKHLLKPLMQSIMENSSDENVREMNELQKLLAGITSKKNTLRQLRAQGITKSISRFARNTVDCLNYIRELKSRNIAIYFEKENINTLDASGEVLITIMASLAQQESESLSQNVRLGIEYRSSRAKSWSMQTASSAMTRMRKDGLLSIRNRRKR